MTNVLSLARPELRRLLLVFALAGLSAGALSGCNTVEGVGEDLESAGDAIQDEE